MNNEIELSGPDWEHPFDECPNCGQEFKETLKRDERPIIYKDFEEGKSEHGEYSQAKCVECDFILQRHYENADVDVGDDHLVAVEKWSHRAQKLERDTVLKRREAEVKALKEEGSSHSEIADTLGVSESTVGEYSRRISKRIESAVETVHELDHDKRPEYPLVGKFDGWVINPASKWSCAVCNTTLEPGDTTVLAAEYVGRDWKPIELFCDDCTSDDYMTWVHGEETDLDELLDAHRNAGSSCVIVEGVLDRLGDDYVERADSLESPDSLTLREPTIREFLN